MSQMGYHSPTPLFTILLLLSLIVQPELLELTTKNRLFRVESVWNQKSNSTETTD